MWHIILICCKFINIRFILSYSHKEVKTGRRPPTTKKKRRSLTTTGDQIRRIPINFRIGTYSPTGCEPVAGSQYRYRAAWTNCSAIMKNNRRKAALSVNDLEFLHDILFATKLTIGPRAVAKWLVTD